MNIVVLGPQGSGKGTQAAFLAQDLDLEHIDMGAYLRRVAKLDTPLGKEIYRVQNIEKGLVPERILEKVLRIKIQELPRECGIVFDGVPRNLEQASYLDRLMTEMGREIDAVIFIAVKEETSVSRTAKRWTCKKIGHRLIMGKDIQSERDQCPLCNSPVYQRKDDTPEGLCQRLAIFRKETKPIIENYRGSGKLIEIDGEETIKEVRGLIREALRDKRILSAGI